MPSAAHTPTRTDVRSASATDDDAVDVVVRGKRADVMPASIGRHRVVRRLGAGGMGVVYVAHDPDLDRQIAIKLLRADRAKRTEQATARVMREAQAMARVSHPNVIAVYDVGRTPGGEVYIAMELVEGEDLDAWVARASPDPGEIVDVYRQAGAGLAAAHAAGLVHRDFKPTNALRGADGRVRVLDFGLARAGGALVGTGGDFELGAASDGDLDEGRTAETDATLGEGSRSTPGLHTPLTRTGAMLGTPAYMAPEQFAGTVADARSDQFSYCVALWKALYGERPFAGRTVFELSARVLEGKRRVAPGDRLVPSHVHRALERGLSTDPRDRFEDMPALLEALAGGEPSASRRRRRRIAATVAGFVALAFGAAVATWGLRSSPMAEVGKTSPGDTALPVPAQPEVAEGVAETRATLERARAARAGGRYDDARTLVTSAQHRAQRLAYPPLSAEVDAEHGRLLADEGDWPRAEAASSAAYYAASEAGHETLAAAAALDLARVVGLEGSRLDEAEVWWKNARTAVRRSGATSSPELDFVAAALDAQRGRYRLALEAHRSALGALPTEPGPHERRLRLEHLVAIANLEITLAQFDAARGTLDDASQLVSARGDTDPLRVAVLDAEAGYAAARGDMATAVTVQKRAHQLAREAFGDGHPTTLDAQRRLAERQVEAGTFHEAERLASDVALALEHRLGPDHPAVAAALRTLGAAQLGASNLAEARETLERAHEIDLAALGPQSVQVGHTLAALGAVDERSGNYSAAREAYRQALRVQRRVVGEMHPWIGDRETELASVEFFLQDYETMAEHCQRALAVREATLGPSHPDYPIAVMHVGGAFDYTGDLEAAGRWHAKALAAFEAVHGPEHDLVGTAALNLSRVRERQGRLEEALTLATRAQTVWRAIKPADDIEHTYADTYVGRALLRLGRTKEAVALLEPTLTRQLAANMPEVVVAHTRFALARALWERSPRRARTLLDEAEHAYVAAGRYGEIELAELKAWRASPGITGR